jgi:hypothetical protein
MGNSIRKNSATGDNESQRSSMDHIEESQSNMP